MQQTLVRCTPYVLVHVADVQPPLKTYDHFGNTFSDYPLETGSYQQQHYPQDRSIDQYQLQPQSSQPLPSPSESIDSLNGQQPYPTTPMSIQYLQLPIPPMNPPNYYQSGIHRPDARQDMNQTRQPVHQSPHMQSGNVNVNGNGQPPNQRYVPPHHNYSSDGSPVGYGYNGNQQSGYSQYQQSPYSPYQPLAPPVHQIPGPPGPSGYMVSPPSKDISVSTHGQSQSRKIAPKKRTTTSPKKKNSPTDSMSQGQGREKWKWDVPDEVYARMNSEEKKQVRNRCGARAFRAKRKGRSILDSTPSLSLSFLSLFRSCWKNADKQRKTHQGQQVPNT
jgi:hypothetical protein